MPATVLAAEGSASVTPQPRVRLQRLPGGDVARVDNVVPNAPEPKPVVMDRMVVKESKLPATPRSDEQPEQKRFSPLLGGPMYSGRIGAFPIEIGLWPWRDVFAEDARFKPPRTRIDFEVVRIKW